MKDETIDLAVKTHLLFLGIFFLHKNRFLKTLPNFYVFHKDLSLLSIAKIDEEKECLNLIYFDRGCECESF